MHKQLFLLLLIASAIVQAANLDHEIAIELEKGTNRTPLLEERGAPHQRAYPRCIAARALAYLGLMCCVGAQTAVYFYRDSISDPEMVELFGLLTGAPAVGAALIDACGNGNVPGSCF